MVRLLKENRQLQMERDFLKKQRSSSRKFELIDAQKAHFPVDFMCQQLGVSRSGYSAWQERPAARACMPGCVPRAAG